MFDAAGKETKIKYAPPWMFDILAKLPKIKKEGKKDIILFSKWTLTNSLVEGGMLLENRVLKNILKSILEVNHGRKSIPFTIVVDFIGISALLTLCGLSICLVYVCRIWLCGNGDRSRIINLYFN